MRLRLLGDNTMTIGTHDPEQVLVAFLTRFNY